MKISLSDSDICFVADLPSFRRFISNGLEHGLIPRYLLRYKKPCIWNGLEINSHTSVRLVDIRRLFEAFTSDDGCVSCPGGDVFRLTPSRVEDLILIHEVVTRLHERAGIKGSAYESARAFSAALIEGGEGRPLMKGAVLTAVLLDFSVDWFVGGDKEGNPSSHWELLPYFGENLNDSLMKVGEELRGDDGTL